MSANREEAENGGVMWTIAWGVVLGYFLLIGLFIVFAIVSVSFMSWLTKEPPKSR